MSIERISANKASKWIGSVFVVLSSVTTFMFFWSYMPGFIRLDWLGEWAAYVSPVLSGVVGVLLLDYAAVKWLQIYLYGCDEGNNEQRSTAEWAFWFCLAGSTISSGAYLLLSADSLITLDVATREWVGIASIIMIAAAVVFNFYSKLDFDRNSNVAKQAIREAERMGRIAEAREEEERHLDELIAKETKQRLAGLADEIAAERADSLADDYRRVERAKATKSPPTPPHLNATRSHPHNNDGNGVSAATQGAVYPPLNTMRNLPPVGQPAQADNVPRHGNGVPDYQDTIATPAPVRERVASEGSPTRPTMGRPGPL